MSELIKLQGYSIDLFKNSLRNAKLNPLTTTQRLALIPALEDDGLVVWDSTLHALYIWDGTTWKITGASKEDLGLENVDNTSDATKDAAATTLTNKTIVSPIITTPTGILKSDVGLSNVDNTSDINKPISTVTQTALDLKAPLTSPTFTGTVSGITKVMVGLGNVDDTSDLNKPISTATQTALDLKLDSADFVFTADIPVVLSSGKTLGKYINGDTIPSTGKTPLEVLSLLATEYLLPTFASFSVSIDGLIEVGDALSGNKTFTWATTNSSNITTNSILVRDVTSNIAIGSNLTNDGSEILDIGVITNTSPISRNWRVEGVNTNSGGFQSGNYTVNSIYPIFYGVSNSAPIANQSLIDSGIKNLVDSTGTINITFGASFQYLWFAHPASNTTKTKWYVNAIDNGNIGTVSDLFNAFTSVSINSPTVLWNGILYKIYITNTPVNTTGNMELRNS